jgi:hypothetical protein
MGLEVAVAHPRTAGGAGQAGYRPPGRRHPHGFPKTPKISLLLFGLLSHCIREHKLQ